MRTMPYLNNRIISVIRDLFFSGGIMSFARRFDTKFPTVQSLDGETREVSVAMVALVATAVSKTPKLI
jgi:hypothetical protein